MMQLGEYTLNGTGDSWFRKLEDHPWGTKGFGLAIKSLKITNSSGSRSFQCL